jgi:hypothetical protein
MKMGDKIYWTATMLDINTAQVLYSSREQLTNLGEAFDKLPAFCSQMLDKIPAPNYFVGMWNSGGRLGPGNISWRYSNISPYDSSLTKISDDNIKIVIMYNDGRCEIVKDDGESIKGAYSYDYKIPLFTLMAGDHRYEGVLFFNNDHTQFYVRYAINRGG